MEFTFSSLMNCVSVFGCCLKAFSEVEEEWKDTDSGNSICDLLRKIPSKVNRLRHLLGGQIRFPLRVGTDSAQAYNCSAW